MVEGLVGIVPTTNPANPPPASPRWAGGGGAIAVSASAFAVVAPQVQRHGRRPSARSPLRGCVSPEALSQPKSKAKRLDLFQGFTESICVSFR